MQGLEWLEGVKKIRRDMLDSTSFLAAEFGAVLGGVTQDDLLWAVGMIRSRAFSGGMDVALAPYIDLLNHSQGSACQSPLDYRGVQCATISASVDGEAVDLGQGKELTIDYRFGVSTIDAEDLRAAPSPLLNLGFIPSELLSMYRVEVE